MEGDLSEELRVSVSSTLSSSTHGSVQDDYDVIGDLYVWGEMIWDGSCIFGTDKMEASSGVKTCLLQPKQLDSALFLDVQHIACGGRHAALITKKGELFTWGEASGGRLGHAVGADVSQPQLVDALANHTVTFVACGEHHTCAITKTGELYTWGDSTHHVGLLGHGNSVGCWIPRRVSGFLEGVKINYVACGVWHVALITTGGKLFTFGDGTFGVLGHGDCKTITFPREVEGLKGLKTVRVACGVWHTAAVVQVRQECSSAVNCFSGKLFTWGDGDKGRLGHGDRENKLFPICVSTLKEYNIQEVACGHTLTAALASGQVFTMGSSSYGQLGTLHPKDMLPNLVEGKLVEETVEEVACGAYHVAVLTAKKEVYTWGKGASGRLGHGNMGDCRTPTLVEALKNKQVKKIACGSNFTAAICLHKRVSGAMCSGCRQSFGLTRKRHNCHHCGLVYCHSCSHKKVMKAAFPPNTNKTYRVCHACYLKLNRGLESSTTLHNNRKENLDKPETKIPRTPWLTGFEQFKWLEGKSQTKHGKKYNQPVHSGAAELPALLQLNDLNLLSCDLSDMVSKIHLTPYPPVENISRAVSPFLTQSSPPQPATSIPALTGLASPKCIVDNLRIKNNLLSQEVLKLRSQVESLTKLCQCQENELQQTAKLIKESTILATEESIKYTATKEVIRSLTVQVKEMAEKLLAEMSDNGCLGPELAPNVTLQSTICDTSIAAGRENGHLELSKRDSVLADSILVNGNSGRQPSHDKAMRDSQPDCTWLSDDLGTVLPTNEIGNGHESEPEKVEQDEPGVYLTFVSVPGGTKYLKRVRFSRKRFSMQQAEIWWSENRGRVIERYNLWGIDRSMTGI